MNKLLSIFIFYTLATIASSHSASLDCSKLPDKEKSECLPVYCKKDLLPLRPGEILITLGSRPVTRIFKNSWKSTFEGKELTQVKTLYSTQYKQSFDVEPAFDYDALQDTCFTSARSKNGNLKDDQLYSSVSDAKFGTQLSEQSKKLLNSRVSVPKGSKLHVYGISDLNGNGSPEIWYRSGNPGCEQLDVVELTQKPTAKLLVFPFSTECGE